MTCTRHVRLLASDNITHMLHSLLHKIPSQNTSALPFTNCSADYRGALQLSLYGMKGQWQATRPIHRLPSLRDCATLCEQTQPIDLVSKLCICGTRSGCCHLFLSTLKSDLLLSSPDNGFPTTYSHPTINQSLRPRLRHDSDLLLFSHSVV